MSAWICQKCGEKFCWTKHYQGHVARCQAVTPVMGIPITGTPLTDKAIIIWHGEVAVVDPDFARSLETVMHQLAEAGKEERGASDHLDYSISEFRCDRYNAELPKVVSAASQRLSEARKKWDVAAAAYDKLREEGGTK